MFLAIISGSRRRVQLEMGAKYAQWVWASVASETGAEKWVIVEFGVENRFFQFLVILVGVPYLTMHRSFSAVLVPPWVSYVCDQTATIVSGYFIGSTRVFRSQAICRRFWHKLSSVESQPVRLLCSWRSVQNTSIMCDIVFHQENTQICHYHRSRWRKTPIFFIQKNK